MVAVSWATWGTDAAVSGLAMHIRQLGGRQRWDANRVARAARALFRGSPHANASTDFSQDARFFRGFRALWSDIGEAIEM
jgi:hypothetical protein